MDYNEIKLGMVNRHPWELSRTRMLLGEWKKFLDRIQDKGVKDLKYVNIGAGDMFFDDALMDRYANVELYADDLGYDTKGQPEIVEGKKHLTTDVFTLFVVALPIYLLYEVSIQIVRCTK